MALGDYFFSVGSDEREWRKITTKNLYRLINEQIEKNIAGYYPIVLPQYIDHFQIWRDRPTEIFPKGSAQYTEALRVSNMLHTQIKEKILSSNSMINNKPYDHTILPVNMHFSEEENSFKYLHHLGEIKTLKNYSETENST